ncbi:hypothetical protein VTL71DRAFT_2205 [Oculimacula yallundae]|uniref:Uncharacterized protein n=1 Tax=Oculimacula yallundae TaxID=86028 RepID=A0ABR4C8D4_9HELO
MEEEIRRCKRTRSRLLHFSRNLLEFNADEDSDGETESFRTSSYPVLGNDSAPELKVSFVHRTLAEYMTNTTAWNTIIQRANQDRLITPHLLLLACIYSKFKSNQSHWQSIDPDGISTLDNGLWKLGHILRDAEKCTMFYLDFVESMCAQMKCRFSNNWTEIWDLPREWGCGTCCVLARLNCFLHVEKALDEDSVLKCLLLHLLAHVFQGAPNPYQVQRFLDKGFRVNDLFLGRFAWEYFLWNWAHNIRYSSLDWVPIWRLILKNGANPNHLIQPITTQILLGSGVHTLQKYLKSQNLELPCYPLHLILQGFLTNDSPRNFFQIIKDFINFGAGLDTTDAAGTSVLDTATSMKISVYNERGGQVENIFNFAPIVLRLRDECDLTSKGRITPDDSILTSLADWGRIGEPEKHVKLRELIKKLEREGYAYQR